MTSTVSTWMRHDIASLTSLDNDARVHRCYIARIWHYWEGRNAWHGSRSNHYPLESAFAHDREQLISEIRGSRKQGSQFRLQEFPVLVLTTRSRAIAVADTGNPIPFAYSVGEGRPPSTLHALASWAIAVSAAPIAWQVSPPPEAFQPPFRLFESLVQGPDQPLGWIEGRSPLHVQPAYELANRLSVACKP